MGDNIAKKSSAHENSSENPIGRIVYVRIDRPLGSRHPKHPELIYRVNYGFVPGIIAPDGEEQDAYVLGVDQPIEEFSGRVIAVIHRRDDIEDKWVVVPTASREFTREQILSAVEFQERYFDSYIEL